MLTKDSLLPARVTASPQAPNLPRPLAMLHDLPASALTAPLDALGDLAAAAGYEARGARAEAEFYLGLGLAKLADERVAPASVAGLLRLIAAIAQGTAAAVDRR